MLGSSLLASRCRSAVSPKVASSGTEISKHFLSLVADDFTFSPPRDDLNAEDAVQSRSPPPSPLLLDTYANRSKSQLMAGKKRVLWLLYSNQDLKTCFWIAKNIC